MDDNRRNGENRFSFDPDEIFTSIPKRNSEDINSFSSQPEAAKEKFVVHLGDTSDSYDYDFGAFSDAKSREAEKKRREELDKILGNDVKSANGLSAKPAERKQVPVKPRSAQPQVKVPGQSAKQSYAPVSRSNVKKPAQAAAPAPEQKKPDVRKRTVSVKSNLMSLVAFICAVAIMTTMFTFVALSAVGDIFAINRSEETVTVQIGENPTMNSVIDALHDAGLIKQKWLCTLFAKYRHFDGYTDKNGEYVEIEYESGVFYLEPKSGLEGMLSAIKVQSTNTADTVRLIFPEGWTITQIFERLEKNGVCDASKLYANLDLVAKQYDFYESINKSDVRYLSVEGYLFPDTYEFYKNENAVSVLKKLFDNSNKKWTSKYDERAKKLGYTRDEILTIASIIQREAANKSQMANVSSVIHNRLKSSTYPTLQCNSTSDYVTNYVKKNVSPSYAQIYADSYNTYSISGLTPGPICNPGIDAIEAALYPNDTNYYFFCHNNDGKIYLSSTYAQFQKDWLQVLNDNQ
ncbi:MAG: endolytic transglycosylase MltG [Ruminococcaceae bacterium]|nr:endolytic transglycosylase MltG [Oscillospiraceae bacterium]